MLVISRKENEAFRIEPAPGVDDSLTLREAFSRGPIVVKLVHVGGTRVRIAIASPPELKIRREAAPRTEQAGSPEGDLALEEREDT